MGQFTSYSYGNGAVVSKTYDSWYQPDKIWAKVDSRYLMNQDFDFNVKGNLTRRRDILHGNQVEDFNYDGVNRMTTSSKGSDVSYTGDNSGNILTKSDVGTYEYEHSVKKHAVTSIQNPHSSYEPPAETISYTAFNKVSEIEQIVDGITNKVEFAYGANYARKLSRRYENGAKTETNYYTGSNYEVEKDQSSGSEKHYHYITAPSGLAAVFISSGSTSGTLYFVHSDYLGSILGLSNESGYIAEEYAYDAWGNRRSASNWATPDNRTDFLIKRGYTMHEHIDGFGLINMNGRIYDPKLGRFLSPDPILQDAGNTQNLNRYSYVLNNPLKYTDPSGYTYRAQAVTFKGRENPDGSYGNWGSFDGGGGSVFQKMGVLNGEAGPVFEDLYILGVTGNWVRRSGLQKDVVARYVSKDAYVSVGSQSYYKGSSLHLSKEPLFEPVAVRKIQQINENVWLNRILAIHNAMQPVAYSVELNGSAEGGVASSASFYGGILVTRGPDRFKYRSFTSVGIGGGVLGVSGQIVKMNYYYIGDVNHFDLSVFKGPSIDAEISAGEGIIGGAAVSIMKSQIYAGEYLIGIGGFLGAGVGAPVSGSITWQNTVYFDKNTQR